MTKSGPEHTVHERHAPRLRWRLLRLRRPHACSGHRRSLPRSQRSRAGVGLGPARGCLRACAPRATERSLPRRAGGGSGGRGCVFSRLRRQPGLGPGSGPPGHGLSECTARRPHFQPLGRRYGEGRYGSRPGRGGVACEDGPRGKGGPRGRGRPSEERAPARAAPEGQPAGGRPAAIARGAPGAADGVGTAKAETAEGRGQPGTGGVSG